MGHSPGSVAIFTVSLVVFVLWSALLACRWRIGLARRFRVAGPVSAKQDACSIVVAARDEESSVSLALSSFLAQQSVQRVVLVDDDSSDSTLAVAQEMAASSDRLLVKSAPLLPERWIGKSHALHYGCKFVTTEYVLFTDADVTIALGTVSVAIALMEAEALDHLSGFFRVRCESLGEKICAPVLVAIATAVLIRDAPRHGSATGAFNLIKTEFYKKMGGHVPIREVVVDDVALARLAHRRGARSAFLDLSSEVNVRLFRGFAGFFDAVGRSTGPYLGGRCLITFLGGTIMALIGVATTACVLAPFAVLFWENATNHGVELVCGITAATAYLVGFAVIAGTKRYHDSTLGWSLFYPLAVTLLGLACAGSAMRSLGVREIAWRGRHYRVA